MSDAMIDVDRRGDVATVRLTHGKVNAMDVELLGALPVVLADLEAAGIAAAVLTGNDRVFSAGVDLRRYVDGGAPYVAELVPALSAAFVAVLMAPFPIVAAVNGAAIAGGAILAAACDRRILASGARIGASELLVGVPFPVAALEVLARACGRHLDEVVWSGQLYEGDEARRVGLADEVVAADVLGERAMAVAVALARVPAAAAALAKGYLRSAMLERIAAGRAVDGRVQEVWASSGTLAGVSAYLDSTLRRPGATDGPVTTSP